MGYNKDERFPNQNLELLHQLLYEAGQDELEKEEKADRFWNELNKNE